MKKVYNIKLTPKTDFHINNGTGGDDRRIYVKSDGKAYIPATELKGIMRNNAEMFMKTVDNKYQCKGKENAKTDCDCVLCTLFGKAGFKPSRVILDNLYPEETPQREIRTNVSINRKTRKAKNGALVSSEVVSASTTFTGQMTVYYTENIKKYEKLILKSLQMIDAIGSSKSRGLGLVEIEVSEGD